MNYDALQAEIAEWRSRNFPSAPSRHCILGVAEECGELLHAELKLEQTECFGKEPRYADRDFLDDYRDAIADAVIFMAGVCSAARVPLGGCMRTAQHYAGLAQRVPGDVFGQLIYAVGLFTRRALNADPAVLEVEDVLEALYRCAMVRRVNVDAAVEATWAKVKERNRGQTP